ncbi:hypothetical protein ElyMa_001516100 [Elysia marginata]|uniref:Uncharacterized protein n=1 Tax=Elysia marginata TaxID=1093978 RepID=A0AAV4J979_9GAST|nr:hypothetical protein ElyMa_001516100 [Elysia marginata]
MAESSDKPCDNKQNLPIGTGPIRAVSLADQGKLSPKHVLYIGKIFGRPLLQVEYPTGNKMSAWPTFDPTPLGTSNQCPVSERSLNIRRVFLVIRGHMITMGGET